MSKKMFGMSEAARSCGPVQRGRNAGAIPTGARLGRGFEGLHVPQGRFQGWQPLGGIHKAARLCVQGQGWKTPAGRSPPGVKQGF